MSDSVVFTPTPTRLTRDVLDDVLLHIVALNASDLHIQSRTLVMADIYGRIKPVINRKLMVEEVACLTNELLGEHATSLIAGGEPVDDAYEVKSKTERGKRYRFRVNATGCMVDGQNSIQITLRSIPTTPPPLETMALPEALASALNPDQGMVCVTGATGSGKSTLLASQIRDICEQEDANQKIITIESPIEFTFDRINKPSTFVSQSQVGRHVPSFAVGVEAALRRKPTIMLVGESRDPETIQASILGAQTGHLVYTTVHTNGVAETLRRMIGVFPIEQRYQMQSDLIDIMRVVVTQRLLPTLEGKRVAVREYLVFDDEIRSRLIESRTDDVVGLVRQYVQQRGRPMVVDAAEKYEQGQISEYTYKQVKASFATAVGT